jgi:hypothetical protein
MPRMRMACGVTKATNTYPEYVILTVLPLQQWLYEGTSMLRYTFIACLFYQAMWHSFIEDLKYNYNIQALSCWFHHDLSITLSHASPFVSVTDLETHYNLEISHLSYFF